MTFAPGTRLGRYQIRDQIGAGGMGVVYRAYDSALDRDIALKVLETGPVTEARIAAGLNHPNICTVHDVGVVDDIAFMSMELIDGPTLRAALGSGTWPADKIRRIGSQLAEALEHAHAHGVIHRDFKTANVMLTSGGQAKIVDFGISVRAPAATDRTITAGEHDPASTLSGTVLYMAPEVLQGAWADARSDIWALGVVLYEMVAGHPPFRDVTAPAAIARILRDPVPALPADTPPGLARIIERCLAKDPSQRPARAGEVASRSRSSTRGLRQRRARWPLRGHRCRAALSSWLRERS